jgi:nucleoside-diphosphate-sugar epimerase
VAVLVTGVGYIGSALVRRLLAEGAEVVGIENFYSTPRDAVEQLVVDPRFTLVEGSITDPVVLARAFGAAEIDTAFHLAAQASAHPDAAPIAYTEDTNFAGTWRVFEACVAHGVSRVILASSTRLYRTPLSARVHEGSPIAADDLVHLSQLYGEVLLKSYRRAYRGMSALAARLGIVHGLSPVMKADARFLAVPQRFCQAAANGTPLEVATGSATILPFVHLDDAVEGLLRCLDYRGGEPVVNVAAEVRSVASVATAVRAAAAERGLAVQLSLTGRAPRYAPRRIESALADTGFAPALRIEDSVGSVLDYYRGASSPP